MKITYDPKHNIAYIKLREETAEVETLKISDELNIDLSPDGSIFGIELLNANKQLQTDNNAKIVVFNKESGAETELSLTS